MANRQELEIAGVGHPQPFPHAVKIGNMVFTSGIDPIDPATGKVPEGIEEQSRHLFQNIRTVMAQAGGSPANIGQVTLYMQDPAQRQAVNKYWIEMFPNEHDRPTRKTIKFDFGAASGILVQAQFIAVL